MHTTEYQYIQTSHNSQIFLAHCIPSQPLSSVKGGRAVIFVPPFAEEMNRSKRMYVLCSRLLADSGVHAFCFDYSGTGDSSGEWGDFSYSDWVEDLNQIYKYATNLSSKVSFIALRFGALVLADAIDQCDMDVDRCVFWDPIENGEILTRQLIRIKIAAAMADESKKLTTKEISQNIQETGYLESGGYYLSKSLIDDINSKKLASILESLLDKSELDWMLLGKHSQINNMWLPNSFSEKDLPSNKVKNILMHPVNDVKFWMQQEVTISPELLRVTARVFADDE